MKTEELSQFLVEHAIQWVQSEREGHRSTARDLTEIEKSEFSPFFHSRILGIAKIKMVPCVRNPGFYLQLQDMAVPRLLDFTQAAGITFKDTILVSQRYLTSHTQLGPLIFHELVHVVQYEVLGVTDFIERYVRGWADNGFDYFRVPLEAHAYELQQRYETDPKRVFAVVEEMQRRLGEEQ